MAMLGLCSLVYNFVFSMFFLLLCHGDTFVVTQGNVTQLTCCARFVNGVLLLFLITIMHSDLIQFLFVFNIVVGGLGMFAVTRGWDGFCVGSNRFVNG